MALIQDKTGFANKAETEGQGGSQMAGVSVRGWLALWLVGSLCVTYIAYVLAVVSIMIYTGRFDPEMLKLFVGMAERLGLVALGYYFGKDVSERLRGWKKTKVKP